MVVRHWRSFIFVPAIVIACSLAGGLVGPNLTGVSAAGSEDDVKASSGADGLCAHQGELTRYFGCADYRFRCRQRCC